MKFVSKAVNGVCRLGLAVSLAYLPVSFAQQPGGAENIPDKAIASLRKDLSELEVDGSSASRLRRAYKSIVRDGEDLIEASPEAPNRFRVINVIFESQKRLLGVENNDRNRETLFETSEELAKAPDQYADLRLEADLILAERSLAQNNADLEERTKSLDELIARYRDTPGETKSLMVASQIAPKLEAFELEKTILAALAA